MNAVRSEFVRKSGAAGRGAIRRLGDDGGYFRHPDRAFAALVDVAGRDLRGRVAGLDGAVP